MAKKNLTARTVAGLKPEADRVDYFDTNTPGFCIRVTPNGVKSFAVMYRHAGRLRRFTLGTYPRLGLADARQQAQDALRNAQRGIDPAAEKKAARQADTFGELAADFMERYSKKRKRSWKEDQRIIDVHLLPRFKNVRASEVKRGDVRSMLDSIAGDAPIMANRALACIRKIYSWGIENDLVESNPCIGIGRPGVEKQRDRVLSEKEIKKVWQVADSKGLDTEAMIKLRLLTAQRGGEIARMRWQDMGLEEGWWTIPAEFSKNGLAHRVPLSPAVLRILKIVRADRDESKNEGRKASAFVFPNRVRPSEHFVGTQKVVERVRAAAGVEFRGHDLRRTVASHMAADGVPRLVLSKIL